MGALKTQVLENACTENASTMQTYLQVNWCILTADRLKVQDWKIVNSSKYTLSCCTYVFHRCRFVLAFSVLAFSTLAHSYLRIPYLHIPSSGTFVFRTCVFSRPIGICHPRPSCSKPAARRRCCRSTEQTDGWTGTVYRYRRSPLEASMTDINRQYCD